MQVATTGVAGAMGPRIDPGHTTTHSARAWHGASHAPRAYSAACRSWAALPMCQHRRWRLVPRASSGDGDGTPDIDALARMLSQQAAQLRSSMSDDDIAEMTRPAEEQAFQQQLVNLPPLAAGLEERLLLEVGDGGFTSDDFEIVSRLGHISVQQGTSPGALAAPQTAVIAYVARYVARIAYSSPVPTLVKEYLPVAKTVAYNELLVLRHLCGLPDDKYQAALPRPMRLGPEPPIVPLLGYFTSAPSEDAQQELVGSPHDPDADSLWLVYKWEGLRPLAMLAEAGPPVVRNSIFKKREVAEREAWARRAGLLRSVARQVLAAIDFVHAADVTHGSLSLGSVLISGTDVEPDDLVVKLDGFGFGQWYAPPGSTGTPALLQPKGKRQGGPQPELDTALEEGKRTDLQAVALLLAEAFAAGLATAPVGRLPRAALRRLLFDVFHEDLMAFREYCLEDASGAYARLVAFLDERGNGGWDLLGKLLAGRTGALQLSQHPFLRPG